MRLLHPINSVVVSRNLWLILKSKIWLILNLVKHTWKNFYNSKSVLIFSLALLVEFLAILWFFLLYKSIKTCLGTMMPPGVNVTNILWAAFAPKTSRQKITNPNCKHLKAAEKNFHMKKLLLKYWWNWHQVSIWQCHQYFIRSFLVWMFFCAAFMCLQFGFVIFWQKDFGAKAALKILVKLTPGDRKWQLISPL